MHPSKLNLITLALLCGTASTPVFANDNSDTELPQITIEGQKKSTQHQYLSQQDIQKQATNNGNIVALLRNNPAVQFSNTSNQSTQAGEITPDTVSFHGEPYYNNAFVLDGFSNNDIMNPGSSNSGYNSVENFESPTGMYLAPGNPESFHVNSSLVKEVNVYDSNVPAKYNRFTGGVVDAKLKDPDIKKASGSVGFRTTRDNWTRQHLTEDQQESFNDGDATDDVQPQFTKRIYDLTLNQPFNQQSALLLSYNRTESNIPENHTTLGQSAEEKRLAQTLMLKGLHQANENNRFIATLMYAPHENTYYANNVKDGRYTSEGGGWRANLNWMHDFDHGSVETALAYSTNRNKIAYEAGSDYYAWLGNRPESILDWCRSRNSRGECTYAIEGGLGTLESETNTWTLKQDWQWDEKRFGENFAHTFDAGWSVDLAKVHNKRPEDTRYMYMYSNASNGYPSNVTNVSQNCQDCVPGEQYQTRMINYKAYDATANVNNVSAYFQDKMQLGRVTLTPGINVNYDDFLGNFNISPRFAFN